MSCEVSLDALREFGKAVYENAGMPAADAEVVTEVQLTADLRGVDTHGFQRLPWYVAAIERGDDNPRPTFSVVRESAVHVLLDADRAVGQLACVKLMELVLAKARASGLAIGASRNSNDWGCGAYYPVMAAREGFVAFATTTSVPTLAPFGSRTRLLGNNPMAYAIPRRDAEPIVLDMALTPVALGKVLRAMTEDKIIPEKWGFLDRDGEPTTDASTALSGVIPAIGGYKGTGLSLVMNVLAGVLPGGAHSSAVEAGARGQYFEVVSPELFGDRDAFYDAVEEMACQVTDADPLPGSPGAFLPGEIEERREAEALGRGSITYPASVVDGLRKLADRTGIKFES